MHQAWIADKEPSFETREISREIVQIAIRQLRPEIDVRLDRIVDLRWDPPVTLGVRLVSVADDDVQHAGQAAYVRGLLP